MSEEETRGEDIRETERRVEVKRKGEEVGGEETRGQERRP